LELIQEYTHGQNHRPQSIYRFQPIYSANEASNTQNYEDETQGSLLKPERLLAWQ
jgi:hypothetical protein